MRIGIEGNSLLGRRGPARYTYEILKALAPYINNEEDGFLLYYSYPMEIDLSEKYQVIHLPVKKPMPWMNFTLARQAVKDSIDLMFFPANESWLYPFRKTVITVHDLAPAMELYRYQDSILDRLKIRLQIKRLNKIVHKIITGSRYTSKIITRLGRVPSSKIEIIPYGVRHDVFYRMAAVTKKNYILYVGGFDKRKNLERLLKAHALIISGGYRQRLILAGNFRPDRTLYYDMKTLISNSGIADSVEISASPSDDELRMLYNGASVFVLPSLVEGFGLPVLEAMACGCPVACSYAASLPEVGGEAAIYFNPYDINDMVDKIKMVLDDDKRRKDMVAKGLIQASKYSWDEAGRKVYQIIRNVSRETC